MKKPTSKLTKKVTARIIAVFRKDIRADCGDREEFAEVLERRRSRVATIISETFGNTLEQVRKVDPKSLEGEKP